MLQAIRRFLKATIHKDLEESKEVAEAKPKVEGRKPKKVKPIYTVRDVIKHHHRSLIDDEIPFNSGEPEYLARFQGATTTVLNNMSEEDLEEVENILEAWNKEGAPSEVQLK